MIGLKLIQVSKRGYWNIPAAASDVLITEDNFNGQWGKYANKIFISSYKFGNVALNSHCLFPYIMIPPVQILNEVNFLYFQHNPFKVLLFWCQFWCCFRNICLFILGHITYNRLHLKTLHCSLEKTAAIARTTFSNAFSSMRSSVFRF